MIWFDITLNLAKRLVKYGRKSYIVDGAGNVHPCTIVKLIDSFAVIRELEGQYSLQWLMSRIDIKQKVKGADGLVYVDIVIKDELSEKVVRVPKSIFTANSITSLAKYNVAVFQANSTPMAIYFERLLAEMPMVDAAQVYGVIEDTATHNLDFNCYKAKQFKVHSEFDSFSKYLSAFNKLLKDSTPLQYLLAATMAAPVLTLLQRMYNYDLHSYCINAVGSSSTGKTICSRFCAAAWTNPNDDVIFSAMLATGNAALKRLAGRFGIPTFLDEATILGGIKADEYAYSVYEGREKRRLNSDCSEKASGTWSTIVCMSSEQHFHTNAKNQNGGLAVRVHSMENLAWTASKEHAEKLNSFITSNYGVLGKKFTKLLFKADILDELADRYADAKETMASYCEEQHNDFTDRLCNTYALTYMTAVLLKEMGVDIDLKAVADIMANHNSMVANEQNLALNAFRAIISYTSRNSYKSGIRMFKDASDNVIKLAIEESLLREMLDRAGFKDMKVTIKELDKAGYIIRQVAAGLKSKLTIDDSLCWCYQIDLSSFAEDSISEAKSNSKSKKEVKYVTAENIRDQLNETGEVIEFDDDKLEYESNELEMTYDNEESSDYTDNDENEESYDVKYDNNEEDLDEEYVEPSGIDWDALPMNGISVDSMESDYFKF